MIVDSSALIAINRGEPESAVCFRALLDAPLTWISAANLVEAGTHEELVELGGRYAELFDLQAASYR